MEKTTSAHFTSAIDRLEQVLEVDLPDVLDQTEIDAMDLASLSAFVSWVREAGERMRQQLLTRTELGFYHPAAVAPS